MKKITPSSRQKFIGSNERAAFKNHNKEFVAQLPDEAFDHLFENFGNDHKVAWDVMNNFPGQTIDYTDLDSHLEDIPYVDDAASILVDNIQSKKKTLFITDSDNDGSFAQAGLLEFCGKVNADNLFVEYSQALSKTTHHGFTKELVKNWFDSNKFDYNEPVDIVTADNGINSVHEQEEILKAFPNVNLIITDHHLPDEKNRVLINDRTVVVNPKVGRDYNDTTDYWKNKNISGAHTLMLVLEKASKQLLPDDIHAESVGTYKRLSHISNMVDYVDSDIRHKPTSESVAERNSTLSSLMNSNNTMRKIISSAIDRSDMESSSLAPHKDFLSSINNKVNDVNFRAKSILNIVNIPGSESFNSDLLSEINHPSTSNNINSNFIEQLRPHIFYLSEKDNKTLYENDMLNAMLDIYKDLKVCESSTMDYMRGHESGVSINKFENATVMYPNSDLHELILNRKLLMKTYNEENNGFMMVIDRLDVNDDKPEVAGSFRSLHSIYDILSKDDISDFENTHNLKIEIQGHDKAAGIGFKFNGKSSTMKIKKTLNSFAEFVSDKHNSLNLESADIPLLTTNLSGLKNFANLNKSARGYLSNMNSVNPILMLSPNDNILNPQTQEITSISEFIKKKNYGYASLPTTIDGHSAVLPINLLQKVVESDYTTGIEMSPMSSNTLIGSSTKTEAELINSKEIVIADKTLDDDMEFYKKNHLNNNDWVVIDLEDITLNDTNVQDLENTMIMAIDTLGASITSIDFEAQLGGSPKAFNVGVTQIDIDKSSQKSLTVSNFNKRAVVSGSGDTFLLTKKQIQDINNGDSDIFTIVPNDVASKFPNHFTNLNGDVLVPNDNFNIKNIEQIRNKKIVDDRIIYNRSVEVKMFNKIIKDRDVKVSTNLEDLTGISQSMIDEFGENTYTVDRALHSLLKNDDTVITAWNLPFDMRVIKTNFPMVHKYINEKSSGVFDMAKVARNLKMGYDDNGQLSFKVGKKQVFFYDDELLNKSSRKDHSTITSFLTSARKNTFFEDIDGNYLLEINDKGEVLLIDKAQEKSTGKIKLFDSPKEALLEAKKVTKLPSNYGKYSVPHTIAHRDAKKIIKHSLSSDEINIPDFEGYMLKNTPRLAQYAEFLKKENIFELLKTNPDKANKIMSKSKISSRIDSLNKLKVSLGQSSLLEHKDIITNKLFLNYDFSDSKENNIKSFLRENPETNVSKDELNDLCDIFITSNYNIFSKQRTPWKYQKVIDNLPNNFPPADSTWFESKSFKDMKVLDDLAKKTVLKKSEILEILKDIVEYKKYYGLDETLSEEFHRNVSPAGDSSIELSLYFENLIPIAKSSESSFNKIIDGSLMNGMSIVSPDAEQPHDNAGHLQAINTFSRGHQGITIKKQNAQSSSSILRFDDLSIFTKDNRIRINNIPPALNKIEIEKMAKYQANYSYLVSNINNVKDDATRESLFSLMEDGGYDDLFSSNDKFLINQGITIAPDSSKTDIKLMSSSLVSLILEDGDIDDLPSNLSLTNEDQSELFNFATFISRSSGKNNDQLIESIGCHLDSMVATKPAPFNEESSILKTIRKSPNDNSLIEKIIAFRNTYHSEATLYAPSKTVISSNEP